MKFTSPIIVITSNYGCFILYGKCTDPNKRRLDVHIKELESYVAQIIKGYHVKGVRRIFLVDAKLILS